MYAVVLLSPRLPSVRMSIARTVLTQMVVSASVWNQKVLVSLTRGRESICCLAVR